MKSTQRTQANSLLRQQRLLRGWSLEQVVKELCSLCEEDDDVPGVSADMVGKWERGERKTSLFYQAKLCLLYGTTADQLGFLESSEMSEPAQVKEPHSSLVIPSFLPESSTSTKAIDALLTQEKDAASETVAAHLLSLSGKQLAALTTLGWTQEDIMKALQIVLQGETAMANMNRRQVLQLGASMLVLGGINFPTEEHPSTQKRAQLAQHIGDGIVAGWTLFHTAGTAQVLAVSQSQLALVQQAHSTLHPDALPFLYSGAYRLMGAALFFQQRYKEAFYAHDRGYLAAIESHDTWNIAESLSWAAYVYQECDQHAKAIEAIEEALKVIENRQDEASRRLRAHLFACWAENATMLHERRTASEKLEASEELLDQLAPNEEFDRTKWHQQAGNCAMINGDYATATRHFQDALDSLPQHWTLRHAITLVPLASAYARIGEREKSLEVADKAVPTLTAMNATLMLQQFADYIRHDLIEAYPGDPQVKAFVANTRQRLPQLSC